MVASVIRLSLINKKESLVGINILFVKEGMVFRVYSIIRATFIPGMSDRHIKGFSYSYTVRKWQRFLWESAFQSGQRRKGKMFLF